MHNIITTENILLIGALLLFVAVMAGKAAYRFGAPALLFFLGVGMLFGINFISFHSVEATQFVGMIALCIILFTGGMDTKFSEIRPVIGPGIVLATAGVVMTAVIVAGFVTLIAPWVGLAVSFPAALLLAATMSSTDSASVFSILRSKKQGLNENLRPLLELESGSNDPMAYVLTIVLIGVLSGGAEAVSVPMSIVKFVIQMVLGGLMGYAIGRIGVWTINRINLSNHSLYPVLLLAFVFFTFSFTDLIGGNGYLAVYLAGLVLGNNQLTQKRSLTIFFDGFTWLVQIVMFLTLGLLVNPHELLPVTGVGVMVGVFMILIARPISVFLCLIPYKNFSFKGKLYISWVGLRGAVPIIFATYPMIAGIEHAGMFFNIVFFITILSLLIQGTTVTQAAKWLDMVDEPERKDEFGIELPEEIKSAMSEIDITPAVLSHGNKLMQLTLPDHTLAVMVKREGRYFIPKGNTELKENDKLLMISDNDEALLQAYDSLGVKDYTMKKN